MRRLDQQQRRRDGERILEIALPIVSGLEILHVHPRRETGAKQMKSKRFGEVIVPARVTYEDRGFGRHGAAMISASTTRTNQASKYETSLQHILKRRSQRIPFVARGGLAGVMSAYSQRRPIGDGSTDGP